MALQFINWSKITFKSLKIWQNCQIHLLSPTFQPKLGQYQPNSAKILAQWSCCCHHQLKSVNYSFPWSTECFVKVWSLYVRFNIHSFLDPPLAFLSGPPPMSNFFFQNEQKEI